MTSVVPAPVGRLFRILHYRPREEPLAPVESTGSTHGNGIVYQWEGRWLAAGSRQLAADRRSPYRRSR
jgi:hypothetical protein